MLLYRARPSLILKRMIVNNVDSGLVELVGDPAIKHCSYRFLCKLGIPYNNEISVLSEDDIP